MSTDAEELDADLRSLLADLESEGLEAAPLSVEQPQPEAAPIPAPELSSPAVELADVAGEPLPIDSPPAQDIMDLREVVKRFDGDYAEVQRNLKIDRGKVDTVIALLLQKVETGTATATDTESLVKALDVLTNTNGHAVKLLDSRSRLLSATKSAVGALIQQNVNVGGNDLELQSILSQPIDD
jgi:hypothetical protein